MTENYEQMEDLIFRQLFLSDHGVSFEYTDKLVKFQLDTLVEFTKKWNDLKKQAADSAN